MPTLSITEIAARYGVSPAFLLEAFRHSQLASHRDSEYSCVDGYYLDFLARRWADRLRRMTPEERANLGPADARLDPAYDEVCDELGIDLRTADLYRLELRMRPRFAEDEVFLEVEDAARLGSFGADLRDRGASARASQQDVNDAVHRSGGGTASGPGLRSVILRARWG
ncbi:hypothetical protein [Nocardioides sp. GCM10030258]|uniref:hypothetical protein n=1 Tax=unclassified Nocardioides TaxID=2615069 RepID=UPI003620CF38